MVKIYIVDHIFRQILQGMPPFSLLNLLKVFIMNTYRILVFGETLLLIKQMPNPPILDSELSIYRA